MDTRRVVISIVGASQATEEELRLAEEVGAELAKRGVTIICGGLRGVMEAACRGAWRNGGYTIGILPGSEAAQANPFVSLPIATGMGYARNVIVATASQAVIAIGGSYGTLSEIAYALQNARPVIGLNTWLLSRNGTWDNSILRASNALEAVNLALGLINKERPES